MIVHSASNILNKGSGDTALISSILTFIDDLKNLINSASYTWYINTHTQTNTCIYVCVCIYITQFVIISSNPKKKMPIKTHGNKQWGAKKIRKARRIHLYPQETISWVHVCVYLILFPLSLSDVCVHNYMCVYGLLSCVVV